MSDAFPAARLRNAVVARRRLLLGLLAIGMLAGATWGWLRPRWYAAEVTMVVRRTAALDDNAGGRPDIADFPTLLANRALAADIVKTHRLERFDIDGGRLLDLLQIREVRNTSLLVLTVTLPDPQLAQAAANSFAARALDLNRDLNARDVVRTRDLIKQQLDDAVARLRSAEDRLLQHRSSAQVEVRRADSKAKLEAREDLVTLTSDLEAERNRLTTLERQLQSVPASADASRSPGAGQELVEQARQFESEGTGTRPRSEGDEAAADQQVRRELPSWPRAEGNANPVRQLLEYQVAAARARIAAMEGRLRDLSRTQGVDREVLPDLLALYKGEVSLTRFELEREIAARAVTELSTQYEQARLKVASRVTDLQVIDQAVAPTRPVTAGIALSALIGLLLGAVACVLVLLQAVAVVVTSPESPGA